MMEQRRIGGMHESTEEELCVCPSFNSYSSDRLADIAARVTDEYRRETGVNFGELREEDENLNEEDDDFEFSLVREDPEILYGGQTGPIFPVFNRDLLVSNSEHNRVGDLQRDNQLSEEVQDEITLKDLFVRERENRDPPSSSSDDDDELESVPPGTYCVWKPKVPESPYRCKKSNSTGSGSKRWKLLDLLLRSNSDGKDSYVFLTPKHKEKSEKIESPKIIKSSVARKLSSKRTAAAAAAASPSSSAHEAFYVRNRAIKEVDKRKSYLPYKQDIVGLFSNVNGLSRRTFTPF